MGKTTLSVPADIMQVCCSDPDMRQLSCMRLIAKMPTLAAIAYKTAKGMDIISAMLANRSMPAFMYYACRQYEVLCPQAKHCSNLTVVSFIASAVSFCKAESLVT